MEDWSHKTETSLLQANGHRKPVVAMIVWNDFRNDARVLKEAQTLVHAGATLRVFAVHAADGSTPDLIEIEPGLSVGRVARSPASGMVVALKRLLRRSQPIQKPSAAVSASPKATANVTRSDDQSIFRAILKAANRSLAHLSIGWRVLRWKPDFVHAHDVNTLLTAWLVARLCGARLVYDAHEVSTDREGYRRLKSLIAGIERRLMPRADACITTTDMRARFFQRAWGVKEITVLQNRPRHSALASDNRLRRELSIPSNQPIVLYQGGLQPGRGLRGLISAMLQVPEAHLVLIGGGRQSAVLEAEISHLDLEERVHIIPTVPLAELPSYTASADIGVQPLRNTCFNHYSTDSNKLFEYVMAGLPVIATDFPEIRKVVQSYDLGRLVPPADVDALAAAIRTLVNTPDERERLSQNARQARSELCWEAQEHALVDIYLSLKRDC